MLPKKLISGQVSSAAVSVTVLRYLCLQHCLSQSGCNPLFIPTAASLPACLVPPAGKAALPGSSPAACPLPLPAHRRARFMCPPPKGTWCRWLPGAVVASMGKQEVLLEGPTRTELRSVAFQSNRVGFLLWDPALSNNWDALVDGARSHDHE